VLCGHPRPATEAGEGTLLASAIHGTKARGMALMRRARRRISLALLHPAHCRSSICPRMLQSARRPNTKA